MRRDILHICAALLAFITGFLVSGSDGSFIIALLLAIFFFTLVKTLISPNPDLHYVKVAVLTLLIWTPIAVISLNALGPTNYSCVLTYAPEPTNQANGGWWAVNDTEFGSHVSAATDCSCDERGVNPAFYNSIWAGVVDGKAISKPAAPYPLNLKSANVRGVVAVSVLIDEAGQVVWARSVSGHPLLRQGAREAACRARFAPSLVDGPPVRVSAILTYRFGL